MKVHPGFNAVEGKIAARMEKKHGLSPEKAKARAGAILACATRRASAAARKANPRLNRGH
jgi:hypothetical protein